MEKELTYIGLGKDRLIFGPQFKKVDLTTSEGRTEGVGATRDSLSRSAEFCQIGQLCMGSDFN